MQHYSKKKLNEKIMGRKKKSKALKSNFNQETLSSVEWEETSADLQSSEFH